MQSVVRSTFFVGALALVTAVGLTACGDKVKVVNPPADSSVTSVTVTPPHVTLQGGDKFTFSAAVAGGKDLTNRAVTWASGNTAVATVDQNGVVTAVAGGTTSIT